MSFVESEERRDLRRVAAELGNRYGYDYTIRKIHAGEPLDELWAEAAKLGFLGVNIAEEFGGGGAGIYELSLILEELSASGSGLLMMVVTPAICASIIGGYGTLEQQRRWLPGFADGSSIMAFAITEPEAGSNSHKLTTTGRRDGEDWIVNGRKVFISGVDQAEAVMVVGRTEDAKTGKLKPALYIVPTDAPGLEFTPIEMEVKMPERQFMLFLDNVKLPKDALVGSEDAALLQLFAGLNPERIMVAALAIGTARYALDKAVAYAKQRTVWSEPIGSHQGIAHPLAQVKIELELAKLMMQKAATLYDAGDDMGAADAANMAKYAAAEANVRAVDQAIQSLGGNGLASEYGLGTLLGVSRVSRIAPVSREMLLNYVAQNTLGLPKSY